METEKKAARRRVSELAQKMLPQGDFSGFFDAVYVTAQGDAGGVPWADLQPHPVALAWFEQQNLQGKNQRALVVGCGLGDDAEELARRGFRVTAFDVSPNAILWCKQRFPTSSVDYQVADLLDAPVRWHQAFDFVLEVYTLQALPRRLRTRAIAGVAQFVAPCGHVLVVCRGRDPRDDPGTMPWPLTRDELASFEQAGLSEVLLEDVRDVDGQLFRVLYRREHPE